ncbi:choice-of-anchor A family protein [Hyalangium gracile]|uniref:choice-of-anchor A family protein n=1 Tax=Hyalangium gracile TaxID=394092 RepID=UPI001CCCF413|nr:choice-of-anchor A family protein [Hyalangium gracile]
MLGIALAVILGCGEAEARGRGPTPGAGGIDQASRSSNKVLILASSVSGGRNSREAQAVVAYSPETQIDVVSPAHWKAMTAEQFMAYRAIIIGDAACQSGTAAFQAAIDTRDTWGAVVDGDVVIIASDPTSSDTPVLVENGVRYALNSVQWRTGMYIALGCAYQNAPADTPVPLLEPFGTFKVQGLPGCADSAHMFEMNNNMLSRDFWDELLVGSGGCAARSVFTSYPRRNFSFAAIAMNSSVASVPGQRSYSDFTFIPEEETHFVGTPYILVSGAMPLGAGCGYPEAPPEGEECDNGDWLNGQPAMRQEQGANTCSWSCHRQWCGDGHVDAEWGEECDLGIGNGRAQDSAGSLGTCTAFCKIPNLSPAGSGQPPEARCQDVTVVADLACGASASINDGSFDPDGDLVECTQSPAGPYDIGSTTVMLTCLDQANHVASCTSVVTVTDVVPPVVALNGPAALQLECMAGGSYADPGATASDSCEGPLSAGSVQRSGAVTIGTPGSYPLTYVATDAFGNVSQPMTRTVTVADTLDPVLTLNGSATQTLECGLLFTDPGATATDQCAGSRTASIVKTGTLNNKALGAQTLRYSVDDGRGRSATAERIVTVRDTVAPRIQVVSGPSSVQCNGTPYVDPGATATDTCAGTLTSSITASSNLDQTRIGQYTVTYRVTDAAGNVGTATRPLSVVGPCTTCVSVRLNDYNLFLLEDYNLGPDVRGKVAAGGNISLQSFSVGSHLLASDTSNVLVAGKNLTLSNGSVYGNAHYGGTYTTNQTVSFVRGAASRGTPIDFAARFTQLRSLSAQLAGLTANGTYTRESWGGIKLTGTRTGVNVFNVPASGFTGAARFTIDVPAGSFVLINIRGASATFQNFGYSLSGVDASNILYNFVDTTAISASSFGFQGTVLAPYARMSFSNGNWEGAVYAVSLTGTAAGRIKPLNERTLCP